MQGSPLLSSPFPVPSLLPSVSLTRPFFPLSRPVPSSFAILSSAFASGPGGGCGLEAHLPEMMRSLARTRARAPFHTHIQTHEGTHDCACSDCDQEGLRALHTHVHMRVSSTCTWVCKPDKADVRERVHDVPSPLPGLTRTIPDFYHTIS